MKRPESVLVAIHTPALDFLLLHRRPPTAFWQSVTGSLEAGETPREAALREVYEETALVVRDADLVDWQLSNRYHIPPAWAVRYAPGVTHNTEHVFSLCVPEACTIRRQPDEHDAADWFPLAAALAHSWSWTNRDIFHLLARHGGPAPSS
ncbi:MAG: dihydroneopterin triphosphate diphosphatase [Rhodocyclaceae bacterium]|nr:dihydroneopterin triphosphate diphosphatase [Rhodocyclaceae bacterium]